MAKLETKLICIRDISSEGKKFFGGKEYVYFKNSNYETMFYSIYSSTKELVNTVSYDFFKDNFIEKSDLDIIDKMYNKYLYA
jgi:hypothetical protein